VSRHGFIPWKVNILPNESEGEATESDAEDGTDKQQVLLVHGRYTSRITMKFVLRKFRTKSTSSMTGNMGERTYQDSNPGFQLRRLE
tara:strand:+ start:1146 stop:1406 length:261 start_codon:yes stop_codon:yes gene_type:complete